VSDWRNSSKVISTCPRLLRWLLRMTSVDLFHDPLCPAHAVCYGSYRSRDACSAVVLRELSCREDAGGDQQHALATLVHNDQVSIIRLLFAIAYLQIRW